MTVESLIPHGDFVGLEGVTHLCTGGEAPWLKDQVETYAEFARRKSGGDRGRRLIYETGERCRERMGALWGVPAERIAFMPSAAEGMACLARGLCWQPGDNVVTTNLEFPSVAYNWRNLREEGVEVRLVPHSDWLVREEDLLAAVDERTRVLAISQVSFYTGQNLDITQLAAGLAGTDTLLAIDATHAAGAVQVDAAKADLCVSSSYKWLLATHGVAPCYVSDRAEALLRPTAFGWRNLAVWPAQGAERAPDAEEKPMPERLEPGNPSMVSVLYLDYALERLLQIGIERIEAHNRDLSEQVSAGLEGLQQKVISPNVRERRSGNTCFAVDDAHVLCEALADRGILVWGEYGRVRVSGHLYNNSADVERFLSVLQELI
ncbi:MAG TPA: aminotransferase class V-fold PLP-dependent enzyme [Candidatus Handelsmanbacteria bacterium]|nr:aminotransferase class V-fold PLP-dependent enzyme [Candidatus Handelsmanbacteria bacterium]